MFCIKNDYIYAIYLVYYTDYIRYAINGGMCVRIIEGWRDALETEGCCGLLRPRTETPRSQPVNLTYDVYRHHCRHTARQAIHHTTCTENRLLYMYSLTGARREIYKTNTSRTRVRWICSGRREFSSLNHPNMCWKRPGGI